MKPNLILPFIALAALLGAQSETSANTTGNPNPSFVLPEATGTIQVIACDFAENCQENQNTQVSFPPDQATQPVSIGSGNNAGTASGTIDYQPSLSSSSISASVDAYPASTDFVIFTYFFGVDAPHFQGLYSATIKTSGSISGGPSSSETIAVYAQNHNTPIFSDYACTAVCPEPSLQGSFSDTKDLLDLSVNTIYILQMTISISLSDSAAGKTQVTALIDTTITIDQSGLQLEVSPNLTPTPLPSTWLLMLSGLTALGFAAHRRRTHAGATAAG
jgi:hypothetical protein